MSKKSKTIVITLGVLALLGGAYYGVTVHNRNRADAFFEAQPPVSTLGNLNHLDIVRIETPELTLEKQGGIWELVSVNGEAPPAEFALDQSIIQGMTFILATVWAERVIDEQPEDLSVYGLDMPSFRTTVTDIHGNTAAYLVGDITPFRTSYFVMAEGNPNVFVVNAFSVDRLRFTLDDIRDRTLFPSLPFHALTGLRIQSPQTLIEIIRVPQPRPPHLLSTFSHFMITSPFSFPRGVDNQAFQTLLTPLNGLRVEEFVDDFPSSLAPFGLDAPVNLLLEFGDTAINLLIGNPSGDARYAKFVNAPGVFTVSGLEAFVNTAPFTLIDRFPLLIGVNEITRLSITGGEQLLAADVQGEERDMVFHLNGRRAEETSFRNWFQSVIGLRIDAEIPAEIPAGSLSPGTAEIGTITIEHHLKNLPGQRVSISLVPFNRDFYALSQEGTMEFLIARGQVQRMFQTANTVAYEE